MKIYGRSISLSKIILLCLYYGFARFIPSMLGGKALRYIICSGLFKYCGRHVNIERMAKFGSGLDICIGDYSGIGIKAVIPSNTIIGKYVMMGPNCYILGSNHQFEKKDIPMMFQGKSKRTATIIDNDVWIGRNVIITPGRHISDGSIVGAGCVLTKDFPPYSIIGGNPSALIRSR